MDTNVPNRDRVDSDEPGAAVAQPEAERGLNRRSFVKLIPALGALGLVAPRMAVGTTPLNELVGEFTVAQQPKQPPNPITKENLRSAERVIGIEFTDAQEQMALPGVNDHLKGYEALRKVSVPLDTEPAFSFHPALPGTKFDSGPGSLKLERPPRRSRGSSLDDVAFYTVTQLAELVRSKAISPVELARMYLDRLKRFGPKLFCTITLTEDLAMEQARRAEQEIKSGHYRGPLHGIPWGAKDLFATKGIPTTWGAEPYRNQVIDYDATVVERLQQAGAVLIAKLSMGALAQGSKWFGGDTRNPWKLTESSSGSSAGPASATAAGLVGFSVGTETLGSIVSPSSRCGATGLRPTYGRVSRYGAMGLSWTMDKIGPICRGVEDCAVVLNAIYGPDGRDPTVPAVPFKFESTGSIEKMRIGYIAAEFQRGRDETKKMYSEALDALRGAGAKLEPMDLPKNSARQLFVILEAEAAAAFDDLTRTGGINDLSGQAPDDWPNTFRTARFIPAVEYIRAQRARTLLMQQMSELMSKWDVFVTPAPGTQSLVVTNFTGHPAVVMPCGIIDGHPQAIMFTAGIYDEASALKVALAFERRTEWHTMHPRVDWA